MVSSYRVNFSRHNNNNNIQESWATLPKPNFDQELKNT